MIINLITIIIPCYNEEGTILKIIEKVQKYNEYPLDIIIVDDCSTDKTPFIIEKIINKYSNIRNFRHEKNQGKGAAVCTGFKHSKGDIIIIQDSDLEYDPSDYPNLIEPFLKTDADVVYGTRFKGGKYSRLHFFWHYLANKILTTITNIFTNLNMSDMKTGYKLFKREAIKSIILKKFFWN